MNSSATHFQAPIQISFSAAQFQAPTRMSPGNIGRLAATAATTLLPPILESVPKHASVQKVSHSPATSQQPRTYSPAYAPPHTTVYTYPPRAPVLPDECACADFVPLAGIVAASARHLPLRATLKMRAALLGVWVLVLPGYVTVVPVII